MSLFSSLARHARNYSLASVLSMIAGLVSFPILTRVFSVTDYGVMSLIVSNLTFAVALAKLGMQHATVRFYSEVKANKVPGIRFSQFAPTVMFGMGLLGSIATVLWAITSWVVPTRMWADPRIPSLMLLTSVLVLARVLLSGAQNIMYAQERSAVLSIISVVHRYGSLLLVLGAVLLIAPTLSSYYAASIVAELGMVIACIWWIARHGEPLRLSETSRPLFKSMLAFAIPMSGYELGSVVLQMGDRQVLQAYMGTEAVGLFSAAYNLCDNVRMVAFAALAQAVRPMMLRVANEESYEAAERFVHKYTRLYLCSGLLVVAMLSGVRTEVLSILASAKYGPAADVMPWLTCGMMFEAYFTIAGLGLYLHKRATVTMCIVATGAVVNIGLNVLLVPRFGIVGSAASNLISCLGIVTACLWASRKALKPPAFFVPALKFGLVGLAAYFVATRFHFSTAWISLVVRSIVTVCVYGSLVLCVDANVRESIQLYGRKFLARRR